MSTSASLPHVRPPVDHSFHPTLRGGPERQIPEWKSELNSRLREYRRGRGELPAPPAQAAPRGGSRKRESSAGVAARVAERYRDAPSYDEFLRERESAAVQAVLSEPQASAQAASPLLAEPFTVLQGIPGVFDIAHHAPLPARSIAPVHAVRDEGTRTLVDAFAEAEVPAAQSLPAKLIQFPRELVAARKQRPRLAEGPLYEEESSGTSLRIFEVEAGVPPLYGAPERTVREEEAEGGYPVTERNTHEKAPLFPGRDVPRTGWEAIRLGEHPAEQQAVAPAQHGYAEAALPALHDLAPIQLRLMAALIDGGLVLGSFLLAVLVFASCTAHPPTGKAAFAVAALVLGILAVFYGWLFMSFGGGSTPGMRYARIALCTFGDSNPTRRELQARVPATALALLPLGLGVFWAMLDEDGLGWHDRMTRTYQRSYK